jgi:heme/copper-type cytochrome/quinol oxidase subunit 2
MQRLIDLHQNIMFFLVVVVFVVFWMIVVILKNYTSYSKYVGFYSIVTFHVNLEIF